MLNGYLDCEWKVESFHTKSKRYTEKVGLKAKNLLTNLWLNFQCYLQRVISEFYKNDLRRKYCFIKAKPHQ